MGIGMRASDVRNVTASLGDEAAHTFREAYGPVNPVEALLDEPLADLYSLQVASDREVLPGWIQPILARTVDGQLERSLRAAL